ncbi:MAG: autotransporter outer membrane beta-barrel domain-containing protein, partial [Starkeya sp.]|nr:autotransporter outer membrane beta-barrel domain-containing protein [Starkeya sp.]
LFAQSVGGGGGAGGASTVNAANSTYALAFGLGGSGSTGGAGGNVTATANEAIATQGVMAYGLLAQSVGGGGGAAGASSGGASGGAEASIDMALGGSAGSGQTGGTVTVTSADVITTSGAAAVAVLAQSVGGGGGVGAASTTGGSSGGVSGTLTLAGTGGTGNDGGIVNVTAASLATSGTAAFGILAQSIGGGGGIASISAGSAAQDNLATTLGGTSSGSGGAVTLSTSGTIATTGNAAIGILAQSIGGGGGVANAGANVTFAGPVTESDGGAVEVTVGGALTTSGTNAVGVLAQSIGGGGGAAISDGQAASWTANGGTGTGGSVTVNVNGSVSTTGAGAYGVIAQSVSNGGGLVMNGTSMELVNGSTAASGKVAVNLVSQTAVTATGAGAVGVLMQGNLDPIITIGRGARVIGGVGGVGIVSDGTENYVNSYGWIATVDGAAGMAVRTTGGYSAITNGGGLIGDLSLADGFANSVLNLSGGTLYAGSSLDLGGTQSVLTNEGTLRRGASSLGATAIDGSLTQTATGRLIVRTDQISLEADQFAISGNAALSGAVQGSLYRPDLAMPGSFSVPFLSVTGDMDWSGLTAVGDTAILDFSLSGSAGGLSLDTRIDFTPVGLSDDTRGIANAVGYIQTQGSSALFQTIVPALLEMPTLGSLETAYETIGGGAAALVPQSMINASSAAIASVTEQMDRWRLSQRRPGEVAPGRPNVGPDGGAASYFWGAAMGTSTVGGGLSGTLLGMTVGVDGELPDLPVLAGIAGNFSTTALAADDYGASTSTQYGGVSAYGVYQQDAAYFSAIATLGYGRADFDRNLYGLGLDLATSDDFNGTLFGGRIEAGYGFALGDTHTTLTPFVAFQPTQLWMGSQTESFGALGEGLTYHADTITALPTYLGVQLDGLWQGKDGITYAPFVRAAWMHDFSPDRNVSRSFAEAPGFAFSGSPIPTVTDALDLHAGLEVTVGGGMSFSAGFDAQIAEGYSLLGASGRIRVRW